MAVKPLDPGELTKRMELQANAYTKGTDGAKVDAWTTLATIYAGLFPLRGREFFQSQAVQSELSHRIRIHFRRNVRPEMRMKYGNRIFDIQAIINPEEANMYLDLMCRELPA